MTWIGGWTALHLAVRYGHKEIMRLLIQQKADVNSETLIGITPLILAMNTRDGK